MTSTIRPIVGDIVIINDDGPRVEWKFDEQTELIPGKEMKTWPRFSLTKWNYPELPTSFIL